MPKINHERLRGVVKSAELKRETKNMKTFYERFKDRIDPSDGSVVLREDEYNKILIDAFEHAAALCQNSIQLQGPYFAILLKSYANKINMGLL